MIISLYILIKDFYEFKKSNDTNAKLIEEVIIDQNNEKISVVDWQKLENTNKDIIGWIKIENTNIDYPILKDDDNLKYLNRSYDNLLVVDFTCGATTAQPYFKDYLEEKEKNYHSKLTRMSFRDKDYGWGQYCMKLEFENGKVYRKTAMSDP